MDIVRMVHEIHVHVLDVRVVHVASRNRKASVKHGVKGWGCVFYHKIPSK